MANEVIHTIRKRESGESNLILKLDFSKAYDCVRWDFLDVVILNMGFGERWRGWMAECVSTARVAVLVNGATIKRFWLSRGLR